MQLEDFNSQSFLANSERRAALNEIIYQQQIILAFQKLRENKIEPILIKGWSIERFYPAGKKRQAADIDLCVAPKDYKTAQMIIKKLGFPSGSIDLHRGLHRFDKLPWADLLTNSILIQLQMVQIRVLRPEDNLRVTCIHWLNDGGAEKEKLWDIYYLVANRPADFDWQRCLESNGEKRRQWLLCALAIANRYLKLSLKGIPGAEGIETVLPEWLISAVEKEWKDTVKIVRLEKFLAERDWKSLLEQLRKRLKPNPIASSIEVGAPFDNSARLPYQMADIIFRFAIHSGRNFRALLKFFVVKSESEDN